MKRKKFCPTHHPTCMVHYLTLVNFGPFGWGVHSPRIHYVRGLPAYKKTQVSHPLLHPRDAHNEDHPSGHIFSSSFPPLSHLHTLPLETQIVVIGTKNFGNGNGTPFWEHEVGRGWGRVCDHCGFFH